MLKDKVVIITGAANEVSAALAGALAKEGARLVLGDADRNRVEDMAKSLSNAVPVECNVTRKEQVDGIVKSALDKFGKVDALINNSWMTKLCPFVDMSVEVWDEVLNANLKGAFYVCRAVVPAMRQQKYGRIVNVTSLAGYIGSPNEVHFSTAQAAIMGFTRCVARELGGSNITVNAVALGGFSYGTLEKLSLIHI